MDRARVTGMMLGRYTDRVGNRMSCSYFNNSFSVLCRQDTYTVKNPEYGRPLNLLKCPDYTIAPIPRRRRKEDKKKNKISRKTKIKPRKIKTNNKK